MKKVISILLVIIWMILIFAFSEENGQKSQELTDEIITSVVSTVSSVRKDTPKMNDIVNNINFLVRKCAHFFLYFILAFLVIQTLYIFKVNKYLLVITVIICFLYACTDEIHQLFISGRSGRCEDVLLDTSASILASYLYCLFITRGQYEKKIN